MIDDIKDSIKAKLYDFAYTPFMSSVLISWVLINHKYLLVFFAEYDLEKKLPILRNWDFAFHTPWFTVPCILNSLVPILFGLFYVFAYPKINKKFYEYTLERNKELKKIKQEIEDETPITQEQARELKREHYKLADERDRALDKLKESQKEYAEVLVNALKPLQDEIEAYKVATNVSNTMIDSLKAEKEKFTSQHDVAIDTYNTTINALEQQLSQAKGFLASKNDEYAELEKKMADMEKQLASIGVVNANVEIGGVQTHSEIATNNPDDDFWKVIKYLHDSYDTTSESNLLTAINQQKGVAKAVTRNIINDLETKGILSRDSINQIRINPEGDQKLIDMVKGIKQ